MSYYDPAHDVDRLKIQAAIHQDIDDRALKRVLSRCNANHPLRVLDVGCGIGAVAATRFNSPRFSVVAIDTSASAINTARAVHSAANIEYRVADVHDFLSSTPFDIVWCAQFLQHVPEPQKTLEHLWRLTAPGGAIVCRNSDDGLDVTYPPVPEFQDVIDLTGQLPGASDRRIGRKLYNYLSSSLTPKPASIDISLETVSNLGKSPSQLEALFAVRHGFRLNAVRAATRTDPTLSATDHRLTEAYFLRGLEVGKSKFMDDPFTISFTVQVVATAFKTTTLPTGEGDQVGTHR